MSLSILPTSNNLYIGACTINHEASLYTRVLYGKKAKTKNALKEISKYNPKSVIILGHGLPCEVTLQDEETFISTKGYYEDYHLPSGRNYCTGEVNLDLFPNRNWDIISCYTIDDLGKKAIEMGANSYLGDSNEFLYILSPDICNLTTMSPFLAESSAIKYLALGDPVKAHMARIAEYEKLIDIITSIEGVKSLIVHILEYDMHIAKLLTRKI